MVAEWAHQVLWELEFCCTVKFTRAGFACVLTTLFSRHETQCPALINSSGQMILWRIDQCDFVHKVSYYYISILPFSQGGIIHVGYPQVRYGTEKQFQKKIYELFQIFVFQEHQPQEMPNTSYMKKMAVETHVKLKKVTHL